MHFDERGTCTCTFYSRKSDSKATSERIFLLKIHVSYSDWDIFLFNWKKHKTAGLVWSWVYWPDAKIISPGPAVQWIFRALDMLYMYIIHVHHHTYMYMYVHHTWYMYIIHDTCTLYMYMYIMYTHHTWYMYIIHDTYVHHTWYIMYHVCTSYMIHDTYIRVHVHVHHTSYIYIIHHTCTSHVCTSYMYMYMHVRVHHTSYITYIVHVPESPHSWNDALNFGLAFLGKLTKLWCITGCIHVNLSMYV